jgi:hypothetical protein
MRYLQRRVGTGRTISHFESLGIKFPPGAGFQTGKEKYKRIKIVKGKNSNLRRRENGNE